MQREMNTQFSLVYLLIVKLYKPQASNGPKTDTKYWILQTYPKLDRDTLDGLSSNYVLRAVCT
jgi:hypothetical protein